VGVFWGFSKSSRSAPDTGANANNLAKEEVEQVTSIHPDVHIGHVHLKVSDIERAEAFYRDAFGFEVTTRYGTDAVFMSAGGYHHHIGLNVWHSKGGGPAAPDTTGLYHFAILYPSRKELGRALKRLIDKNVTIDGASDHGVSEAIYLRDPDGNGIELYRDRDRSEWPLNPDGSLAMSTGPLDVRGLLAEAE
jgi:catechol 2,3-dioxygenase